MNYETYINLKKEMYKAFMSYIDDEELIDMNFDILINIINTQNYQKSPEEFKTLLQLISKINRNHYRSPTHFPKIARLLTHYKDYIEQTFTNSNKHELLNIFEKNPQILHFLIQEKLIYVDESFLMLLKKRRHPFFVFIQFEGEKEPDMKAEKEKYYSKYTIFENYTRYFFEDVKEKLSESKRSEIESELLTINEKIFDNFSKKCQTGENDTRICELIRSDSIEEFIKHVNQLNVQLKGNVATSPFETNALLNAKSATLIEYAAFFNAVQIFNFLIMNKVEMTPSLWIYAIHGNSHDIIHVLEENHIAPEDKTFNECLKESIKCHHNEIAEYIQENCMNGPIEMNVANFKTNPISYGFHYFNYDFIQCTGDLQIPLYYACFYDHFPIVKILLKSEKVGLNRSIISKQIFFLIWLHFAFF